MLNSVKATCEKEDPEVWTDQGWSRVGGSVLLHVDEQVTRVEAKRRCEDLDSQLVEIWSEQEWNEVSWPYFIDAQLSKIRYDTSTPKVDD